MYELRFSASQHHIPPLPLGYSTLINPAAAEKVMQEPHFGAFLHHFSPIPGKRPELEVRAEFGLLSKEVKREARRPPPFVLLFFILIPERKELTTNTTSPPVRRQF